MTYGQTEGDRELNQQLNQLARDAQQYPDRSYQRRRLLNRLANQIFQSRHKLYRPYCPQLPLAVSEDLYREALNITVMEICENIDKYDSSRDVLGWVNFVLRRRFIDLKRKWLRNPGSTLDIDDIEQFLSDYKSDTSASEELRQWIEDDPDGFFTQRHITANSAATFQFIVIAKIWEDRKWKNISTELNVPSSTLCEFYKKQLKELTPYLLSYLLAH